MSGLHGSRGGGGSGGRSDGVAVASGWPPGLVPWICEVSLRNCAKPRHSPVAPRDGAFGAGAILARRRPTESRLTRRVAAASELPGRRAALGGKPPWAVSRLGQRGLCDGRQGGRAGRGRRQRSPPHAAGDRASRCGGGRPPPINPKAQPRPSHAAGRRGREAARPPVNATSPPRGSPRVRRATILKEQCSANRPPAPPGSHTHDAPK